MKPSLQAHCVESFGFIYEFRGQGEQTKDSPLPEAKVLELQVHILFSFKNEF